MEKATIKSINKRLGFDITEYKFEFNFFEDDREKEYNPFDLLTEKEFDCVGAFIKKRNGFDYSNTGFTAEDLEP